MNEKFISTSAFYLMITAASVAFFYGCKTAQSSETAPHNQAIVKASPTAAPVPTATPFTGEIPPSPEIKSDEVSQLTMQTVYKNYYEAGSKCRQDYNEYFGKADGFWSSDSPCTINFSFERTGGATKTLEISHYDKAARAKKSVEKSVWTARISPEQFDALAKIVTGNEAFKDWRDGTMITVSNSKVSAVHPQGTRTVMSNADEKTFLFLPLLDAFKQLDKEIKWEKAQ